MKRILIFAEFFYPHIGGYESNIRELASRLVRYGYSIDLVTSNTESTIEIESINGFNVYRLPCWNIINGTYPIIKPFPSGFRIVRKIWQKPYDAIITNTRFFQTSLIGAVLSKLRKIPLLHIERGSCHSVTNSSLINLIARIFDHTFGAWIVCQAQINVSVSNAVYIFLQHLGAKSIITIPNGIDTDVFQKTTTEIRQRLKITNDTVVLAFVGRLIFAKGVQDLLTQTQILRQKYRNIHLLIAGGGGYRRELEKKVLTLNCQDIVSFLGELNRDQLIDMLSGVDILVNPSYSEGLPTSVLEAGSMALAIVATDVGGTREIIEHGKNGLLIKAGDSIQLNKALSKLLDNKGMRKRLGYNARTYIMNNYQWRRITQQMVDIININT